MSSTVRVVRTSFVEAQEEWEQVPVVTLNEKSAALVQGGNFAKSEDNKPTVSHPDLSYREFWEHLLAQYRQHKQKELSKLNSSAHKGFWETLRSFLATIPLPPRTWFGGLSDESLEEKETILHAAHTAFDDTDEFHHRALQTIYRRLTGTKLDAPRYGTHWESIGFQGTDPATDFRGVGILSLLHVLYVMSIPPLSRSLLMEFYALSMTEEQEFPFMVLSINVTRIALMALKEGRLDCIGTRSGSLVGTVNRFYSGVLYYTFHLWRTQKKTIMDSGYVLQDAETRCKQHPRQTLRQLDAHLRRILS